MRWTSRVRDSIVVAAARPVALAVALTMGLPASFGADPQATPPAGAPQATPPATPPAAAPGAQPAAAPAAPPSPAKPAPAPNPPAKDGGATQPAPSAPPTRPAGRTGTTPVRTLEDDDVLSTPTPVDPASPEGQVQEIRKALLANQYSRAESLATAWLDRNNPNPYRPEVFLARGDARRAQGDEYKALYDYEAIATLYPGSDVYIPALQREFDIAKEYAGGMRRKFIGIRFLSGADEAQELFIRIQERLPSSQLAEEAGMALADFYLDRGEMNLAAEAYQLFLENYPRSPQIGKARVRLIAARMASFKGPQFDASGLDEAKNLLLELQDIEPNTAQQIGAESLLLRIDESKAIKLLDEAKWYARNNDPVAAELSIRRLIERYPRTVAALGGIDFAIELLPELPAWVRNECPDYEGLRNGSVPMPAPHPQRGNRQRPLPGGGRSGVVRPGETLRDGGGASSGGGANGATGAPGASGSNAPKSGIRERLKDAGAADREANEGGVKTPLVGESTPGLTGTRPPTPPGP